MLEGLDAINWQQLTHAYGPATDVPDLIRKLTSPSIPRCIACVDPSLCSPYMLIFFQTLSTKGWQVDPARYELPGKDLVLHTARPVRKDRASPSSLPGPIDDWRDVAVCHPL